MAEVNKSYTARDVAAIRKELIELVPTLTTKWTDFTESDLGVTLIELMAGVQDMQNFYFDTQAFETFLDTAVQEKNIRSHLRAMNYPIPLISPAKTVLRIQFTSDFNKTVKIPRYTQIGSSFSGGVNKYYVVEDTVKSGEFSAMDVPIAEGEVKTRRLKRSDFLNNLNSYGNVSRRIYLGYKNVASGSVSVSQDDIEWEQCDDALLKYKGGYYYSVHVDSEGQVYVFMPVNYLDLIPVNEDEAVTFTFAVTNGTGGYVSANKLNSIVNLDSVLEGCENVTISDIDKIYNVSDSQGASDANDFETMKILARKYNQTMGRYVTLDDYKTGIEIEGDVFKCVVKDWKDPNYVSAPYIVKYWAVDTSGRNISEQTRKSIEDKFKKSGVLDVTVEFITTEIINLDITASIVFKTNSSSEKENILSDIREELVNYFSLDNMEYGKYISYSEILSVIRGVSGNIRTVILETPSEDIELSEIQFPVLGEISIREHINE